MMFPPNLISRAWLHYDAYGRVTSIGETFVYPVDSKEPVEALHVTFELVSEGWDWIDIPTQFEGIPVELEVTGKIEPLKGAE